MKLPKLSTVKSAAKGAGGAAAQIGANLLVDEAALWMAGKVTSNDALVELRKLARECYETAPKPAHWKRAGWIGILKKDRAKVVDAFQSWVLANFKRYQIQEPTVLRNRAKLGGQFFAARLVQYTLDDLACREIMARLGPFFVPWDEVEKLPRRK